MIRRTQRGRAASSRKCAAILSAALLLGAAACSSSSKATKSAGSTVVSPSSVKPTTVSMQYYGGNSTSILAYVAQQGGFFRRNNLNVQLTNIASSAGALGAIAGGSLDVISASPEAVLPAIKKGIPIKLISGESTIIWQLVVKTSAMHTRTYPASITQLRGKTLGVTAVGSSGQDLVEAMLETAGLPANSVSYVGTGGPQTTIAALSTGEIQATMTFQPVTYTATKGGNAQVVLDLRNGTGLPSVVHCCDYVGLWGTSAFISAHPAAVRGIQRAMAQAYVWMTNPSNLTAVEKLANDDVGDTIPQADLATFTRDVIGLADAAYSPASLQGWQAFDVKYKLLAAPLSMNTIMDTGVPASKSDVQALAK